MLKFIEESEIDGTLNSILHLDFIGVFLSSKRRMEYKRSITHPVIINLIW